MLSDKRKRPIATNLRPHGGVSHRSFRWTFLDEKDVCWLAGILDGEGSFCTLSAKKRLVAICCQMTDRDSIARIAFHFRSSYKLVKRRGVPAHYKPIYATQVSGMRAIAIMRRLYPHLCERRRGQVEDTIANWSAWTYGGDAERLCSVPV